MVSRPILFPCSDIRIKQSQDKERKKQLQSFFEAAENISYRIAEVNHSVSTCPQNDSQNIREFVSNTNGNEGLQGYCILFPFCLEYADDKFANVMLKLDKVCLQT